MHLARRPLEPISAAPQTASTKRVLGESISRRKPHNHNAIQGSRPGPARFHPGAKFHRKLIVFGKLTTMPSKQPPNEKQDRPGNRSDFAASRDSDPAKDTVAIAIGPSGTGPESVPRVLATGRGEFAETILEIAFRNGIKVREDTDLAEILAAVDLDSEIPVEAFIAVAEILRYVYANNNDRTSNFLKQKARDAGEAALEDSKNGPEN